MTPLDLANKRILALEQLLATRDEEVAWLHRQLEIETSDQQVRMIMGATGLQQQKAMILHVLRHRYPRPVSEESISILVPVTRIIPSRSEYDNRRVAVHISNLRSLIGRACIQTYRHKGYALTDHGKAWLDGRMALKAVA